MNSASNTCSTPSSLQSTNVLRTHLTPLTEVKGGALGSQNEVCFSGVRGKKESRLGEGEVGQGLWEGRTLSANVKEPFS